MANEVEIRITADGKGVKAEIAKIKAEAKNLEKAFDGAGKKVGDFGKAFASFETMGAAAHPKIAAIAALLPVVGAAAGAAVGALAPLAAVAGTVALGMDGIKKAAEQAKKPLDDLKKSVSSTFQKELTQPFKELGQTLPKLTTDFQGVATSVSGMVKELIGLATGADNVTRLQTILQGAAKLVDGMTPGIVSFVDALLSAGAAAAPAMERLGTAIGSVFDNIASQVAYLSSEGLLTTAIDNFSAALTGLGDVVGAVVGTLIEMGAAVGPGFGDMLTALGDNFEPVTKGAVEIAGAFGELFKALEPLMPVLATLAGEVLHQLAEGIKAATPAIKEFAEWCANNEETLKTWVPIVMQAVVAWKAFNLAMKAWTAGSAIATGLKSVAEAVGLIGKNAKDSEKEVGLLRKALEALKVPAGALGTAGTAASGMVQGAGMTAGGALARGAAGLAGSAGVGAAGAGAGVLGGIVAGGALGAYGVAKATGNEKASGNMEAAARGDFSFDQLKEQALQGLEATKQAITQKLNEIKESIKTTIQGWADGIDGAIAPVWESIKAAFSGEGGGGGGLWETIKTSLQTGWDGVMEWFRTVPQQQMEQFFDIGMISGIVYNWAKGIWDQAIIGLDENWVKVQTWWQELPGKIQATLEGWEELLKTKATEMWDNFKLECDAKWLEIETWLRELPQKTYDALAELSERLKTKATETWDQFKAECDAKWLEIETWLRELPQKTYDALQELNERLKTKATESWDEFKAECDRKWEELRVWWEGLPQQIADTLKDLPNLLNAAGAAALDGLIEGMKSKAQAAIDYAKELANQIVSGFNSTQGMNTNSPSKTMRDKAGKWIPLGVVEGMKRTQGRAVREAQLMARKIAAAGVVAGFQPGDPRVLRSGGGSRGGGRDWGRRQWSGGNRFPRDASVVAGFQMDDIRAQAAAQRGGHGGRHVTFGGDCDGAFATAFMKLHRTGRIQIR